ncbi:MAG: hypothetical protein LH473_05045 [Chitinophagales bacterium]|nr:hypothetical protein [Chitinophagales bacterium]
MKKILTVLALTKILTALLITVSFAQDALPATDIYALDISKDSKGKLHFENPYLITKNEGYDNQPWYYADGSAILYCAVNDTFGADILKYNFFQNKTNVLINTPFTAEYSPMVMADKVGISCIRVLEDDSTQVMARCDDKTDSCKNLFPKLTKVAYYAWIDGARAAMLILGNEDSISLQIGNISNGEIKRVAEETGRCIQKVPGKNALVAFVDKSNESQWQIKTYDSKSGKISTVVECVEESEDFCYMPDGSILMGSGPMLWRYVPPVAVATAGGKQAPAPAKDDKKDEKKDKKKAEKNKNWDMVADFRGTAVAQFYRMAVSPKGDKMVMVTYPDDRP